MYIVTGDSKIYLELKRDFFVDIEILSWVSRCGPVLEAGACRKGDVSVTVESYTMEHNFAIKDAVDDLISEDDSVCWVCWWGVSRSIDELEGLSSRERAVVKFVSDVFGMSVVTVCDYF